MKNPDFNYSAFCLFGFKKRFPILAEADTEIVASWLYEIVSAFSGRDGRSLAGGGEDDIRCLVAAAAAVDIEVCYAREIKDALRAKLRAIWQNNDHAAIFYAARGFERAASMAIVDFRDVPWVDPFRIVEFSDEEEGIEIPEAVEEWIETLSEPSQMRSVIGNRTRTRLRRKPAEHSVKSLFEDHL
ncbi:MAG: hypothetical protein PHO27_02340 [Sulfuricurvum sp.]|nr:hypothetical protein [Sulfuricurvum sp.]